MTSTWCLIVAVEQQAHSLLPHLISLRATNPHLCIVTLGLAEHDLCLVDDDPLFAAVSLQTFERLLPGVLASLRWRRVLRWLAQLVELRRVPHHLQFAVGMACARRSPYRSVTELAADVGIHRSTLAKQWTASFGGSAAIRRLEDFLAFVRLIHALALKAPSIDWISVATTIGVHQSTLRRSAWRLLRARLDELSGLDIPLRLERTKGLAVQLLASSQIAQSRHGLTVEE